MVRHFATLSVIFGSCIFTPVIWMVRHFQAVHFQSAPSHLTVSRALTKSVRDARSRKFLLPEKWTKAHQNPLTLLLTNAHHRAKFHSVRPNWKSEKSVTNFLHPSLFWCLLGQSSPIWVVVYSKALSVKLLNSVPL